MGEGRATQWGGARRTITQLLGLSEGDRVPTQEERNRLWDLYAGVSGKAGLSEEQKASLLHSHGSFRAMFVRVPDSTRVTELVAAAWLGISSCIGSLRLLSAVEVLWTTLRLRPNEALRETTPGIANVRDTVSPRLAGLGERER